MHAFNHGGFHADASLIHPLLSLHEFFVSSCCVEMLSLYSFICLFVLSIYSFICLFVLSIASFNGLPLCFESGGDAVL